MICWHLEFSFRWDTGKWLVITSWMWEWENKISRNSSFLMRETVIPILYEANTRHCSWEINRNLKSVLVQHLIITWEMWQLTLQTSLALLPVDWIGSLFVRRSHSDHFRIMWLAPGKLGDEKTFFSFFSSFSYLKFFLVPETFMLGDLTSKVEDARVCYHL